MIVAVRIEVYDDTKLETIENKIDGALQGVDCTYDLDERLKCDDCGFEGDSIEFKTDKYWDNEGNHILYYICPKCGKAIYEDKEESEA